MTGLGKYDDNGLELTMSPGMMTPIEEESHTIISDSASTASNNSRNFTLPQKDLIQEINKQRENMFVSGVSASSSMKGDPTLQL